MPSRPFGSNDTQRPDRAHAGEIEALRRLRSENSREAGRRECRDATDALGLRDQSLDQSGRLTAGLAPNDAVARADILAEVQRSRHR